MRRPLPDSCRAGAGFGGIIYAMTSEARWNENRLREMIDNAVEESLTLDYKAALSLDKTDKKKAEITKDVSAMANSAGGLIIYGISEFQDKERSHLPERIDPIDRRNFTKEWLEQVINNIQPRLSGLIIHPVPLDSGANDTAYVIEVPQSNTVHQAKDQRYYRRFNFESVAMYDYEIRDAMNRSTHAQLEMKFTVRYYTVDPNRDALGIPHIEMPFQEKRTKKPIESRVSIEAILSNIGRLYVQHVVAFYYIPVELVNIRAMSDMELWSENPRYVKIRGENKERGGFGNSLGEATILPGLEFKFSHTVLNYRYFTENLEKFMNGSQEVSIYWEIYADNAPRQCGSASLQSILSNA